MLQRQHGLDFQRPYLAGIMLWNVFVQRNMRVGEGGSQASRMRLASRTCRILRVVRELLSR